MGSTSTTALVLDTQRARVEAVRSLPNERETTSAEDRAQGRSEWDLAGMVEDAVDLCRRLLQEVPGGGIDGRPTAGMSAIRPQRRSRRTSHQLAGPARGRAHRRRWW